MARIPEDQIEGILPQSVPNPIRIERRCARSPYRHHLQRQNAPRPGGPGRRADRRRIVGARGRLLSQRLFKRPGSGQVS